MAVQITHGRYQPPALPTPAQLERERLRKLEAEVAELRRKIDVQKEER